jgi:predicted ATPase
MDESSVARQRDYGLIRNTPALDQSFRSDHRGGFAQTPSKARHDLASGRSLSENRWHSHLAALTLNRLSRKQAASMIGELTVAETLPAETVDNIVAKADGVPLFVEELTKAVVESSITAGNAFP